MRAHSAEVRGSCVSTCIGENDWSIKGRASWLNIDGTVSLSDTFGGLMYMYCQYCVYSILHSLQSCFRFEACPGTSSFLTSTRYLTNMYTVDMWFHVSGSCYKFCRTISCSLLYFAVYYFAPITFVSAWHHADAVAGAQSQCSTSHDERAVGVSRWNHHTLWQYDLPRTCREHRNIIIYWNTCFHSMSTIAPG